MVNHKDDSSAPKTSTWWNGDQVSGVYLDIFWYVWFFSSGASTLRITHISHSVPFFLLQMLISHVSIGGAVVVVMKLFFFLEKQVLRHNPTYMIICVCNCCVRDGVLAKRCVWKRTQAPWLNLKWLRVKREREPSLASCYADCLMSSPVWCSKFLHRNCGLGIPKHNSSEG